MVGRLSFTSFTIAHLYVVQKSSEKSHSLTPTYLFAEELSSNGWHEQTEEEYDRAATYFVPDRPCPENTRNRAEASLPRNLCLRPASNGSGDVSISLVT